MENIKKALCGLSITEIENLLSHSNPSPLREGNGLRRYRAGQIYKWIIKGADCFEKMTDIPFSLQAELKEKFCLFSGKTAYIQEDGPARKIAIELNDGAKIESVLLSDSKKRLTACISTQAGCPCGCVFCKTGTLGLSRSLESYEIVEQFLYLKNIAMRQESPQQQSFHHVIDNIVIMGMGEPLLNLENLRKAISVLNDRKGLNFSLRRITVSTCGIIEGLLDIAKNGPYMRLALSLVTGDENLRQKLIPAAKSSALDEIKKALLLFQKNGGGRVTLEIPLLGSVNTSKKDALSIASFAKGLNTVVNIIPWNPVAGLNFEGKALCEPGKKEIKDFINFLETCGLKTTMRLHKGKKINGACGQLGSI